MSERDDRYVANDAAPPTGQPRLPRDTGEFRAAPDISASTAEFKAFAAGQTRGVGPEADTGSWPEQPWDGQASTGGSGRTIGIVVAGIVLVFLIVVLILVLH
jgi:hypothetical protein